MWLTLGGEGVCVLVLGDARVWGMRERTLCRYILLFSNAVVWFIVVFFYGRWLIRWWVCVLFTLKHHVLW